MMPSFPLPVVEGGWGTSDLGFRVRVLVKMMSTLWWLGLGGERKKHLQITHLHAAVSKAAGDDE